MMDDAAQKRLQERLRARHPITDGEVGLQSDWSLNPDVARDYMDMPRRPAAVLVPLLERADKLTVLLTRRTPHLSSHAGQVAFPGGKIEAQDAGPEDAALREAHEEINLHPAFVDVIGRLPDYHTGTGFSVAPIVGVVREGCELVADEREVADIFEVPLSFVLRRDNHRVETREYKGVDRHYYAMEYGGYYIWGATAAILVNFCERMRHYVDEA